MSDDTLPLSEEAYAALAHPIRRKILDLLLEEGEVSYSRLVEVLHLKAGPLYHHLKMLKPFITKTQSKRYKITDEGKKIYSIIHQKKEPEPLFSLPDVKLPEDTGVFQFFTPLIRFATNHAYRTLFEFLIIASIIGYFAASSDLLLLGNFIVKAPINLVVGYASIFGSWLAITLIAEISTRVFFHKKGNFIKLLTAVSLIFIFNFIFFAVVWIWSLSSQNTLAITKSLLMVLYLLFQIWSFFIIASSLIELKELSLEKSIIVALISSYVQIMVIIFTLL